MPAFVDVLRQVLFDGELYKYPDPRLYKAASLLLPEERPDATTSVGNADSVTLFRIRPKAAAFYNPPGQSTGIPNHIILNENAPGFDVPEILAARMAHEGVHAKRIKDAEATEGWEEAPAYAMEAAVLRRLGFKDKNYIKALEREARERAKREKEIVSAAIRGQK